MQAKFFQPPQEPSSEGSAPAAEEAPLRYRRGDAGPTMALTRRRHRRPKKPVWSLLSGAVSFLSLLAIVQSGPGAEGLRGLHLDTLTGHLLWWALGLAAAFGLAAFTVLVAFRLRNPEGKRDTDLRHYAGRILVKLSLVGMFFFVGWLGALLLVAIALMLRT